MLCGFRIILILCIFVDLCASISPMRGAIIITLAGSKKLSSYFEWSCRTFENADALFDMLVFHESNERLNELYCANNVKFIDLGEKGLSKLISYKIMNTTIEDIAKYNDLYQVTSEVLLHLPRLLVNIKPMSGYLFSEWLQNGVVENGNKNSQTETENQIQINRGNIPYYSHWSYSDPDIIWGNIHDWIDTQDLMNFDIISIAKTLDAGRLFVRGQFALHKNNEKVNNIYKSLSYLSQQSFAKSVGEALGLLRQKKSGDEVYSRCFHSAEGWYSSAVMKSGVSLKIIGRGFDDFQKNPVIMFKKQLVRCPLGKGVDLPSCILKLLGRSTDSVLEFDENESPIHANSKNKSVTVIDTPRWLQGFDRKISDFTAIVPVQVEPVYLKSKCFMNWLPVPLRYCVATKSFDHDPSKSNVHSIKSSVEEEKLHGSLGGIDRGSHDQKLERVGESFMHTHNSLMPGVWSINNEEKSRRQVQYVSPMFHFRHWDDYCSKGTRVMYHSATKGNSNIDPDVASSENANKILPDCMVLYISDKEIMTFENCESVLATFKDKHYRIHSKQMKRTRKKHLRSREEKE